MTVKHEQGVHEHALDVAAECPAVLAVFRDLHVVIDDRESLGQA